MKDKSIHLDRSHPTAVFLGPTLSVEEAKKVFPANYLPPVQLGSLYQLLATPVELIVIIDGFFDGTSPVWQREILALLEANKRVVGASSMGALRAVELEPYGMQGFGQIYEWYRDGTIHGDDEVALLHGVEQLGYMKVSEPFVNIRFNLQQAMLDRVITSDQRTALLRDIKSMYFGDRNMDAVYDLLDSDQKTVDNLKQYIKENYRDLKKEDALTLLSTLAGNSDNSSYSACLPPPHSDTSQAERKTLPSTLITNTETHIINSLKNDIWFHRPMRYGSPIHDIELQLGAVLDIDGKLTPNQQILESLIAVWDTYQMESMGEQELFYLRQCTGYSPNYSSEYRESILKSWRRIHNIQNLEKWLSTNGMERADWQQRVLAHHRVLSALQDKTESCTVQLKESLIDWITQPGNSTYNHLTPPQRVSAMLLMTDWFKQQGYQTPDTIERQQLSVHRTQLHLPSSEVKCSECQEIVNMYTWMMAEGPASFGFNFNPVLAVFKRLQLEGRIGSLL